MAIHAVVFDLGNVLIDVVHARAGSALSKFCCEGPQRLVDTITNSPLLHRIERGEMDAEAFFTAVSGHAICTASFDEFSRAFCDIFTPVTEMIAVNTRLRESGIPTYMCSNTSAFHFDYLTTRFAFMTEFNARFLSYEVRCMKPDTGIYRAVEKGAGHEGDEILFIDDRRENVEAAAALGWQVIHHIRPAETIDRLRVLGLLQS